MLEDFVFDNPKTKNFTELMKSFQLTGKKILLVMAKTEDNVVLSARNLKRVRVIQAADLNTYEILDATQLLLTESSIQEIEKIHQN